MLAFDYIPVVQQKCDIFVETWNSHRIKEQKDLHLTTGVKDHILSFPESYGGTKDGFQTSIDLLREVFWVSEMLLGNYDFLGVTFRTRLRELPHPE